MHVGQNQNEDRQDFSEVMYFCLVIVDTRSVTVVLNDVDDQARHRIQGLESKVELSRSDTLEVAIDTGFGADAEEERRNVFDLQNTLLGELGDIGNKGLLGGV